MRPGYPDVLCIEGGAEHAIVAFSLVAIEREDVVASLDDSFKRQPEQGYGMLDPDEAVVALSGLLDIARLNSAMGVMPDELRRQYNSLKAGRQRVMLKRSDLAFRTLDSYAQHSLYSEQQELIPDLRLSMIYLHGRKAIKRHRKNRR